MDQESNYKGLFERSAPIGMITAVCPAAPMSRLLSASFSEAGLSPPEQVDVWEVVNDGQEISGTPIRQNVPVDQLNDFTTPREQMGIPTRHFASHRVF